MKRMSLFSILISVVCILPGCGFNNKPTESQKTSDEKSIEIVRCFDEKDVNGLKSLFCDKVQTTYNLDDEIQTAFDFYEGKSESYDLNYGGTAGGWEDGECIDEHITPSIKNIRTTSEKEYSIFYTEYTICDYDKKKIGIIYLSLFDENDIPLARISWSKEYADLYG